MSSTEVREGGADNGASVRKLDMKLEVMVVPVSDVDRAKTFYGNLGWRLDADITWGDVRVVQFTPPGSPASIHVGSGNTSATPGSAVAIRSPDAAVASRKQSASESSSERRR